MSRRLEPAAESRELSPSQLRWRCDPDQFDFDLTSELGECPITIIGQPRAMTALKLGFDVRSDGYNIFVVGEVGTGRSTAVRQIVASMRRGEEAPEDLVYVHNFKQPDRPRLLAFPAGRGREFQRAMTELIDGLRKSVPELFDSDPYRARRARLVESAKSRQKSLLKAFEDRVKEEGFALVQVQMGPMVRPGLMPVVADNPVEMDKLEALTEEEKFPQEEFERLKSTYTKLGVELEALSKDLRKVDRNLRQEVHDMDKSLAEPVVRDAVDDVREAFEAVEVRAYLDQVGDDVLDRLDEFRELADYESSGENREQVRARIREATLPFQVNLLVDNSEARGRPILWETSPTFRNLFGTVERAQDSAGHWRTDHTRIKPGSLAQANGGYLILDALDVLAEPGVWPGLKRVLRTHELEIQSFDPLNIFSGVSVKPESVHLDVKVILIGTRYIYRVLYHLDEDFKKIFKVKADFALRTPLNDAELFNYACFVHKQCEKESLPPFRRDAVAAVVEHGVRLAGRQQKLTTRFKAVADVIREAGYWAAEEGSETVEVSHVDRALAEGRRRFDLVEEVLRERIADGSLLLDIEGEKTGQVNGLVVLDVGDYAFGQPARITAVTAMGRAGIIDVERESEMSGSVHTKGVLILAGFLRERFAQDKPLTLSASICFEQSYGMVEGDSASSAELYALLSSLSGVPVRQGITVTGSVNQKGQIQPIGGVNEKIEGYFDLCRLKGLTGEQGVMIPARNLPELMLRKDVVAAVEEGRFKIWSVSSVEEGIEILSRVAAGRRGEDGSYPPETVFGKVDAKLRELAEKVRDFGAADVDVRP